MSFDLEDVARSGLLSLKKMVASAQAIELKDQNLVASLKTAYKQRRLALVLGAGVSVASKIPDWGTLISGLSTRIQRETGIPMELAVLQSMGLSPLVLLRYLQSEVGLKSILKDFIRQELYKDYPAKFDDQVLTKAAQMVAPGSGINEILTYNFDNILEQYIEKFSPTTEFCSVTSNETLHYCEADLQIYHPHGYVSQISADSHEDLMVISEDEYHREYFEYTSWRNVAQINLFSRKTCLFIGISFTDPNLRRLLDHLKPRRSREIQHICVRRAELEGGGVSNFRNRVIDTDLRSLGVAPFWIESFADIPGLLDAICAA